MNERIRQLAEQAGLQLGIVIENSTTPVKTITIEQRKFAELIIQECVLVINTEAAEHEDDDEIERAWKMGTEFAVYQIKQHFGVEVTELDEPETPFWRPVMTNTVADLRSVVNNAMNRGEHNIAIALIELIKKNS